MPLTPDSKETINGLTVYTYNLFTHNPNKISMPAAKRKKTVAITIHNTGWINVASNTTPAEQYVRATQNGAMNSVRVHYYVDNKCAWRCMPDEAVNWSCADGTSNANSGNNTSVAIEVIGDSKEAEANAVKLAAHLLNKYNLTLNSGLRTHTYWLNVRDGKTGTVDYLNTLRHPYKWCPAYILPHWTTFKAAVGDSLAALQKKSEPVEKPKIEDPTPISPSAAKPSEKLYRIRKSWDDVKSQLGAFTSLDNAKKKWQDGYYIFDSEGKVIYPEAKSINITYCVYSCNKWNGDITNFNNDNAQGYAGIKGKPMSGLAARLNEGKILYRVHIKNGGWLSWISKCDKSNWYNGCAGFKSQQIDAVQMRLEGLDGYSVRYRVSAINKDYYPWVVDASDYAGRIGYPIDRIQAEIIKSE